MLRIVKLIAASAALAALPLGAQASVVTYDFTVTATAGSLADDVASGSLSFDDSLLPAPNTTTQQNNLLTNLSFTWNGSSFNASTANTGQISSGAAGQLALISFGDNCTPSCTASAADPNDWFVAYNFLDNSGRFVYADHAGSYVSSEVTFAPVPTPLPSAAWLFLSAVALGGMFLRFSGRARYSGLQPEGAL